MPVRRQLRIVSWNVNGLRACTRKGFLRWLQQSRAQIVGLQEVRALPTDLDPEVCRPPRWHTAFSPAERRGYSGVGLYSRIRPDQVTTGLGRPELDREGRLQIATFGRLAIANVYFPKGSGLARDNSRVPYKLDFYGALLDRLLAMRRSGLRILVIGDFNTAHRDIDLARPRQNVRNSGFLPEERRELQRWLDAGFVDTFRHFEPRGGHYSWWSQRIGARERNLGWRIDYVLASTAAMRFTRSAFISSEVRGSDHCPVGVVVDAAIMS